MMNSLVALSYGWSIIGSHCRARFGQFSLNALHSPYLFGMMRSPGPPSRPFAPSGVPAGDAGMPWY